MKWFPTREHLWRRAAPCYAARWRRRVRQKRCRGDPMAPRDKVILGSLQQNAVAIHVIPSAETTYMKVVHPSADVDERQIYGKKC